MDETAPTLTAHPEFAGNPFQGARSIARYHATLDQELITGRFKRKKGDALCKPARDFWELTDQCHPSPVSCPRCLELAKRYGVAITNPEKVTTS